MEVKSSAEHTLRLKTCSPCFRVEQFAVEKISGESFLTMQQCQEKEFLNESFFFSLFDTMFNTLPNELQWRDIESCAVKKYFCVPCRPGTSAKFYILLEQGETGFEVSSHAFICDVNIGDDGIDIEIQPTSTPDVLGKLVKALQSSGVQSSDVYFDSIFNKCGLFGSNSLIQAKLEMLEKTGFIRIAPDSSQIKLGVDLLRDGNFNLRDSYLYRRLVLSADGNEYQSKRTFSKLEIGTLLYKRDNKLRDRIGIWKVIKFVHDFNSDFFAVAEQVAMYPHDAEKIKTMYPSFYAECCISEAEEERNTVLNKADPIPYLRDDQRIGDGIIYLPLDTSTNELSVAMGEYFHLSMKHCNVLSHYRKGDGKLRVRDNSFLCSLIEIERRFRLAYYKVSRFVKHNDAYYVELRFHRASPWFDFLEPGQFCEYRADGDNQLMDDEAITILNLLLYRKLAQPLKLDKKQLGVNLLDESKV